MNTRNLIKDKSRQLFNEHGLMNVTLRDVAKQLGKSYGNITYHFATKEVLIYQLFEDMNSDLSALQYPPKENNLLEYFLMLPKYSFDITLRYLFLTIDYIEIKRNFPDLFSRVNELNNMRKIKWMSLLKALLEEGYLKRELVKEDLQYIMLFSVSVRTTYFQFTEKSEYEKDLYVKIVNMLLRPYLSASGMSVYRECFLH